MAHNAANTFYKNGQEMDVEAYKVNYGAHREGISTKEMAEYYSNWAKKGTYETDLCPGRYDGPEICAAAVAELFPGDKNGVKILDVAAGTGFLGVHLVKHGFKNSCVDALDPAEGMLAEARKKDVYNKLLCDTIGHHQTAILNDTYDCLAIAGGMGEGHIPSSAIHEMIRVVKPGGFVVIVMREEYLTYVNDYIDLEEKMAILEDQGTWKLISRKIVPNYSFNKNGIVFVNQIC